MQMYVNVPLISHMEMAKTKSISFQVEKSALPFIWFQLDCQGEPQIQHKMYFSNTWTT